MPGPGIIDSGIQRKKNYNDLFTKCMSQKNHHTSIYYVYAHGIMKCNIELYS